MPVPAILEQGRWDPPQAILRAPQTPERTNKYYPLSGFLRCACGGSLSGVHRKERDLRFYQCSRAASSPEPDAPRCPHRPRSLPADNLEGPLAQLDAWDTDRRASRARLSQLDHLAHQATKNLAHATPQDQHRVYELLDLHIAVTPHRTSEIPGNIPTP